MPGRGVPVGAGVNVIQSIVAVGVYWFAGRTMDVVTVGGVTTGAGHV